MSNLSDGKRDGLVLFYVKDLKLHSVALSKGQAEMLDLTLGMVFSGEPLRIAPMDDEFYTYNRKE